jgi:predicted MPP superfamily phosphohydrolase
MREDRFVRHVRRRRRARRLFTMSATPDIVFHDVAAERWRAPPLNIACLSDLHVMAPWTPLAAVERWVEEVNTMRPDIVCLLGDYIAARPTPGRAEAAEAIARQLARLEAPLGVHAILGNHDWLDDDVARERNGETSEISQALTAEGLRPLLNSARRVTHGGTDLWLVGMDTQRANGKARRSREGRHDPDQAFAEVPDDSLAILLAHEPDYFVFGDRRPVLQLSGHTHGGQANFFGWRPFTPSDYASRYAYGHVVEDGQHLVVSGGLGYTHLPLRIAQPPEITLVRISAPENPA